MAWCWLSWSWVGSRCFGEWAWGAWLSWCACWALGSWACCRMAWPRDWCMRVLVMWAAFLLDLRALT